MSADIFISYRRAGGAPFAQVIHDRLVSRGYRVHLDVDEGFGSGRFSEKIYQTIAAVKDVIVVLAPGSLDRCVNEGDWVRQEIAYAIQTKRNLVPVLCPDFDWPASMPEDIADLVNYNGVNYSYEYLDAVINKLETVLVSRPEQGAAPQQAVAPSVPPTPSVPEPVGDDEPLEPDLTFVRVEPSRRGLFGKSYSREDIQTIRGGILSRLTEYRDEVNALLAAAPIPSRKAYRAGRAAMRTVREEMGFYAFWSWEEDQARLHFEKSYEVNLARIKAAAERGEAILSEDLIKTLRQYNTGLETLIRGLSGR